MSSCTSCFSAFPGRPRRQYRTSVLGGFASPDKSVFIPLQQQVPLKGPGESMEVREPVNANAEEVNAAKLLQIIESDPELRASFQRHRGAEGQFDFCLRYVRARPHSLSDAQKLVETSLAQRTLHRVDELASLSLQQVLSLGKSADIAVGSEEMERAVCKQLPHGFLGLDFSGRVAMYRNFGSVNVGDLEHLGVFAADMLRQQNWINEKCLQVMGQKGQWVQVIDLAGVSWSQCTSRSNLELVRLLAATDSKLYVERLGQVFLINVPSFFSVTWKLVGSWLETSTRDKVRCLASHEWREVLSEHLDLRLLPPFLKGETELSMSATCKSQLRHSLGDAPNKRVCNLPPLSANTATPASSRYLFDYLESPGSSMSGECKIDRFGDVQPLCLIFGLSILVTATFFHMNWGQLFVM